MVGIPASDNRYRITNSKEKMVVLKDGGVTIDVMVLSGRFRGKTFTVDRDYFRTMGACMV